MKKVLLTGATSFTGCHIARAFVDNGFEVVATLTKPKDTYNTELFLRRMQYSKVSEWRDSSSYGTDRFSDLVKKNNFTHFVMHGAPIENYRSAQFDYLKSVESTLKNIQKDIKQFADNGGEKVIYSGTIFEPDEGEGGNTCIASSIYGASKKMIWEAVRYFSESENLDITKIIIPNPIGRFENVDRLVPQMFSLWKAAKKPHIWAPHLIRDQLPAEWLSQVYKREVESDSAKTCAKTKVLRPSGFILSNLEFVNKILVHSQQQILTSNDWGIDVEDKAGNAPIKKINTESVPELSNHHEVDLFWKNWIEDLWRY